MYACSVRSWAQILTEETTERLQEWRRKSKLKDRSPNPIEIPIQSSA